MNLNHPLTLDQMAQVGDIWRNRAHRLREFAESLPSTDERKKKAESLFVDMTIKTVWWAMDFANFQMMASQPKNPR